MSEEQKEKLTFTKLSMILLYSLFLLGGIIGGMLTIWSAVNDISLGYQIDVSMFIAYGTYLGAPTTIAISFYAWKSKSENILKIYFGNKKINPEGPDLDINNLINMGGG